jgi:hypothetical protein
VRRASLLALALVLLAACKRDTPDEGESTSEQTEPATPSEEARRALHLAAFETLLPLATQAMKLADPLAAAQVGLGPLRPAPTGISDLDALRDATEKARLEAAEIDESLLAPEQRVGLRTMRFVTARIHDRLTRHPPTRSDPTIVVGNLSRVLDELEYRSLYGDCGDCEAVLDSFVAPLGHGVDDLTAASDAGLGAALGDLDRLQARVERFPARTEDPKSLAPVVARVVAEIGETRGALTQIREQLPNVDAHDWADRPPLRGASADVLRLPDRIGGRSVIRRLEVEEGLAVESKHLMSAIRGNLARFSAMREELAGDAKPSDRPRPVDAARCQQAWDRLAGTTLTQPGFEDASIDCTALARHLDGERLDDADLLIRVVDLGVTEPVRRAFRRSQDPSIALASGRWTPDSQRILRRIMVLGPTEDRVALGRAIDAGTDALCAAGTSLWVHAALGADEGLRTWLEESCASRPPERWIDEALGHPRDSLMGLGVASVSTEPASMVGIDMFYWAPLGLVPLLATPPEAQALPEQPEQPPQPLEPGAAVGNPAGVQVKVEELGK